LQDRHLNSKMGIWLAFLLVFINKT